MRGLQTLPGFMIAAAALAASMIAGVGLYLRLGDDAAVYAALAAAVPYSAFAWLLLHSRRKLPAVQSRRYFFCLLGFGILLRGIFLILPPHSTDVYRYVWDGRVQAHGINPYAYVPADPAIAGLRDSAIYPKINRREDAPTIYPPAAQAVFFAATRLSETVTAMKAAMLGFEALAVWALIQLLAARGLPVILASLYLLHPLPVWEIAGSGHVDGAMIALILLALLAAEKGARFASGAAFAASVLTKYFPLALTPAIYCRWDWRMPASFAAAVAILYLPYLSAGEQVFGFLGRYAGEEYGGAGGFYIAAILAQLGFGAGALPIFLALGSLILIALALRSGFRPGPQRPDLGGAFAIAVASTVLASPHYPWYFLWLVPFLCFFPRPSVFWLTLSAPILYRFGLFPGAAGLGIQYVPAAILFAAENLRVFSAKEASHERAAA